MEGPSTHPLESQVGGHAGVMTTEDGSLIIKPAVHQELEFYQQLQSDSALEELLPYTPKFLGTLKLQGQIDPAEKDAAEGLVKLQPIMDQKDECSCYLSRGAMQSSVATMLNSIVIENLSFPFLKPNILDIKLGTVLYDKDASEEKIARMKQTAIDTTSLETGVRLTGFQVYDNITSKPVNTPKSYGKTIKASELPDGFERFFPVGTYVPPSLQTVMSSRGLPRDTLILVLRAIRAEVAAIRDVLADLELRMVGGSLLIIYEADWPRAAEAIKKYMEDEEEEIIAEEEEEDDENEVEEEDPSTKLGPPITVKLIDFAHTALKPGEGPDEGVLLGVDTVLRLLDGRLDSLGPLTPPPSSPSA